MLIGKTKSLALIAGLSLMACGDDTSTKEMLDGSVGTTTPDAGGGGTVPPGTDEPTASTDGGMTAMPDTGMPAMGMDAGAPVAPAYLAATRVFTPDGTSTTYMQVLSSIEAGSQLELEKAQEFAGPAELFHIEEIGWFGVGDGEAPVLTRYTLGDDGKIQPQQALNLSSYGLQDFFADKTYYVSPTKVYYPDPDGKQLVIINPTAMTVEGVVALPQTAKEGYTPVYSYASVPRGDKLLFSVGWFDWTNDKILPETGLVVLDTTTNTVARFDVDARCGGITDPVTVSSGDTYFVSSALAGALFKLGTYATPPCALRVPANAEAFDPTYTLALSELTGGAIAGEPIPAGGNGIFLRVLDDSLVTIEADTASWEVTGEPAWGWLHWDVVTGQVTPVDLAPSTSDVNWFEIDKRVFAGQTTADYATTTLIELTAAGGPKAALTSPGFFSGLAKIR